MPTGKLLHLCHSRHQRIPPYLPTLGDPASALRVVRCQHNRCAVVNFRSFLGNTDYISINLLIPNRLANRGKTSGQHGSYTFFLEIRAVFYGMRSLTLWVLSPVFVHRLRLGKRIPREIYFH